MNSNPDTGYLELPLVAIDNIRKEYNLDTPERITEAVNILQEWIQKQDHIIKKDFGKDYLERTLITCKGSIEKSKKQIDRLCTFRTLLPKFFTKVNIKTELQHIAQFAWAIPLPKLTEDYYRTVIIKLHKIPKITSEMFLHYYQLNIILAEYLIVNDYLKGFILIHDMRSLDLFELVTALNTVELQQFVNILIKGYGSRIKSIIYLSDSKTVELLVKLMKQFMSEKISSRILVMKTIDELYKTVPKTILPTEYGGSERSLSELYEQLMGELNAEKHVEYMKIMNQAGSDETKRQSGQFNDEYMGMPGSFRCLSVD